MLSPEKTTPSLSRETKLTLGFARLPFREVIARGCTLEHLLQLQADEKRKEKISSSLEILNERKEKLIADVRDSGGLELSDHKLKALRGMLNTGTLSPRDILSLKELPGNILNELHNAFLLDIDAGIDPKDSHAGIREWYFRRNIDGIMKVLNVIFFTKSRGKLVGIFQGGQSWVCQIEGLDKKLRAVTIFTENENISSTFFSYGRTNSESLFPPEVAQRIKRRLEMAERASKMSKSLPKEVEMARVQTITETGKSLDKGFVFIVSDWVEGTDLLEETTQRRISENKATGIVLKIARTVNWGYQNFRLILTDITPENIIYSEEGVVTLIDCLDGIVEGDPNHQLGKLAFAAPEQRYEQAKLDSRTMTYQLGVLLYFMLAKEGQALDNQGRAYYLSPNLEERFPGINNFSFGFREVIRKCTLVDNDRLSLGDLVKELERLKPRTPADQIFQVRRW